MDSIETGRSLVLLGATLVECGASVGGRGAVMEAAALSSIYRPTLTSQSHESQELLAFPHSGASGRARPTQQWERSRERERERETDTSGLIKTDRSDTDSNN